MRILFLLAICHYLYLSGYSQEELTFDNPDIEVQIEITDPLYLSVDEYDMPMLKGGIKVILINHTDSQISILPLNVHGLKFFEKTKGEVFTVFHSCDCFHNHPQRVAAGDTITEEWKYWSCDGSSFTPPPAGEYMLSYGTNYYLRSNIDQSIKMNFSKGNREEAFKLCKQKNADMSLCKYQSEQIPVSLREKKIIEGNKNLRMY